MSVEDRIEELGITLPNPVTPAGNYVRYRITGNLIYISGTGPGPGAKKGKVGDTVTKDEAYDIARECGLSILATVKDALGSLDRVTQAVKVLGMVNAIPEFDQHPAVINGCSDLLVEVLGEAGRHTRSAVGMGSLPGNIAVEIEATFEFE